MLIYSPLSAYFDDIIPQQPALSKCIFCRCEAYLIVLTTTSSAELAQAATAAVGCCGSCFAWVSSPLGVITLS
jgi:hypothetical protein